MNGKLRQNPARATIATRPAIEETADILQHERPDGLTPRELMTPPKFSAEDIRQIESRGMTEQAAARQVAMLGTPPPPMTLLRAATTGDGILELTRDAQNKYEELGQIAAIEGRVSKFVPASGAATRMFKDLIASVEDSSQNPRFHEGARRFFESLDEFPFAAELRLRAGLPERTEGDDRQILRTLLHDMGYAARPKALIPFHRDGLTVRSAFEEQLIEACAFAKAGDGSCRVHFTVAEDAVDDFRSELARVRDRIGDCTPVVSFSIQHPSTDSLAIDDEGAVFRNSDGSILFRPGGHGALILNLEKTGGDLLSIKNIDNILPAPAQAESVKWKLILTGFLAQLQERVFASLRTCESDQASPTEVEEALSLAKNTFHRPPSASVRSPDERRTFATEALNRPLRVCGVVRNEGEPGGAPFWTTGKAGATLQIVESSQVRLDLEAQRAIWTASTHFNPVDLVCGLRDWTGRPFPLSRFVDEEAVFVSHKTHQGRTLTALERPGLWNGAMAEWNTVCVEVPASTFAPVKTVLDLLRPQHQSGKM